jgi:uncharacterized membrane protein YhhN
MKVFMQKWGITIYILILSAHLYAQVLGPNFASWQFATKALLLPTLMAYLVTQNFFPSAPKVKWLVLFAMLGSFLGDVLLSYDHLFIVGMLAFMTTHIFNILMFHNINGVGQPKSKKFLLFTLLLLAFCVLIYLLLQKAMGTLIYPILVYMALICSAALMAIHAGGNSKGEVISTLFWLPGMLFFISSDAVLAFNKFDWSLHHPIKNIGLVTMLTYGMAQLFLAKGFQLYFTKLDASKLQ